MPSRSTQKKFYKTLQVESKEIERNKSKVFEIGR